MAKHVFSNPGRALDLTARIATAVVSTNSKQALSTLPRFATPERLFTLENFYKFLYNKWTKNQIEYTHLYHWKKILILNRDYNKS